MSAIIKSGVRVLSPAEFRALESQIQKTSLRLLVRALLYTGMRYQELLRLKKDPSLFDLERKTIRVKSGKARACQKERYVRLTPEGVEAVRAFLADERETYPSAAGMMLNLQAWAKAANLEAADDMEGAVYQAGANEGMERRNVWGLSVKTFRKSWESWLTVTYEDRLPLISLSQGHETETAMRHYWALPFTADEKQDIRVMVEGWGV
jgi:integrase